MKLFCVRHGETLSNLEGRIQGQSNSHLSPLGIRQCQAVADVLGTLTIDAVVASPLERAMESARYVADKLGLPVQTVRDILKPQHLTRTPLAPDWIAGLLNLRGRIVTAIDLRRRLGLPLQRADGSAGMSIVVEHHGAPYCLLVDSVSDVLTVNDDAFEA